MPLMRLAGPGEPECGGPGEALSTDGITRHGVEALGHAIEGEGLPEPDEVAFGPQQHGGQARVGHRRIGCLAEPLEHAIATQRIASFHRALAHNRIEVQPQHIVPCGFREYAAVEATGQLLDGTDPPSALVAFNDLLAIGALRAAASRDLDVPGELSVVGFDDIHAARYTSPPLTTLRHDPQDIGCNLIAQLLAAIEDPGYADDVYITPELVVRESTGPLPRGVVIDVSYC